MRLGDRRVEAIVEQQAVGQAGERVAQAIGAALLAGAAQFELGAERVAEGYYRYRLNERVEVSPDLQWIQRPGADGRAATTTAFGLRARVGF